MARYVAFLRGVSPMNAKMADLRRCFEQAGFGNVTTVLSSGNVVFDASARPDAALARAIEAAMAGQLARSFHTIVRRSSALQALIDANPYAAFDVPANAKRIVTFLTEPPRAAITLPDATDGVHMLAVRDREVFTAYVPDPRGPLFMALIERRFGTNQTTRTWETVKKCAAA